MRPTIARPLAALGGIALVATMLTGCSGVETVSQSESKRSTPSATPSGSPSGSATSGGGR